MTRVEIDQRYYNRKLALMQVHFLAEKYIMDRTIKQSDSYSQITVMEYDRRIAAVNKGYKMLVDEADHQWQEELKEIS